MKEMIKFAAEDGKEFRTRESCLQYETIRKLDKYIIDLISSSGGTNVAEAILAHKDEFITYLNSL